MTDNQKNPATATLWPHAVDMQEMLDKFALQQLVWTYCRGIDRRDYALVRSLYHDDAIDDHGPMFYGSPDEYVAWLPSMMANWDATSHIISNALFIVDGDRAEGELFVNAYHRTHPPEARELIAGGRYLDQYEKRDGIWRFKQRSLVLDWMENRPVAQGKGPSIDDGVEMGKPGPEDASYTRLPLFAADRLNGKRKTGA